MVLMALGGWYAAATPCVLLHMFPFALRPPGVLLLPALLVSLGCGIPMVIGGVKMLRLASQRWASTAISASCLLVFVWPCSWTLAYVSEPWSPDAALWYMLHFLYLPVLSAIAGIWAAGIFAGPAIQYAFPPHTWVREHTPDCNGITQPPSSDRHDLPLLAGAPVVATPACTETSDAPPSSQGADPGDATACLVCGTALTEEESRCPACGWSYLGDGPTAPG